MSLLKEENFCILPGDNRAIIALPTNEKVYLKGKVEIENILKNDVVIYGAKLNSSSSFPIEVFSPRGYSLISLEAKKADSDNNDSNSGNEKDKKVIKKFMQKFSEDYSIFILRKSSNSQWTEKVETKLKFSDSKRQKMSLFGKEKWKKDKVITPEKIEDILDISLIASEEFEQPKVRFLQENPDWEIAVQSCKYAQGQSRIVGIGGKGVGKSTMLKFITNRLIQDLGKPVIWIDFDPGQAEFTLPGCLSCTLIESPILGPNFSHLNSHKNLVNLYLGSVNVSEVMQRYIQCIEYIAHFLKSNAEFKDLPWIVNTMGFNRGPGIHLLKKTLDLLQPTTLVEIKSRFAKKNYEFSVSDFVSRNLPSCNLLTFEAMPESLNMGGQDNWGIPEAYKLRDIVILSYLEQQSFMDSKSVFCVSLDKVKIQVLNSSSKSQEHVLNAGLVSLGTSNGKEIIESKAFGVVQGINIEQRLLYLKTSLTGDEMSAINCLTCGSINLPHGYFLDKGKAGNPYVSSKPTLETPLNIPWQRSGKPRLSEFQQQQK